MKSLILVVLLAASLACFADSTAGMNQLASYIVPQDASYALEAFPHQNATAYVVLAGGEAYAVFLPNPPFADPIALTKEEDIASALRDYYIFSGRSPDVVAGLLPVHSGITEIQANRKSGESKCRTLIGTDRYGCTSFDSCQLACYSVTSFCQPVALGTGRDFINIIWAFENNTRLLDSAYAREEAAFSILSANASRENFLAYLTTLEELNRQATRASSSQLYDAYSYCFSPDYSLSRLTVLQLRAQLYYREALLFYDIGVASEKVKNRTVDGLVKKATHDAFIEPFRNLSTGAPPANKTPLPAPTANASQNGTNSTSAGQKQPAFSPDLFLAIAFALVIFVFGTGLFFYLEKRKRRHRGL